MSKPLEFPNDENGAVLRRLHEQGDDLSQPRNIDFEHIFPTRDRALAFIGDVTTEESAVEISWYAARECWNVRVTRFLIPTHADITAVERELELRALEHGGKADGWGCMSQARDA